MFRNVLVAAAFAAFASPVMAASLTITSISGVWQNSDPAVSGLGTSEISWGTDIGYGQSGYTFEPTATPATVEQDTDFVLGTFQHLNHTIRGTLLQSVDLLLSFTIDGLADPITTVFSFAHWETYNQARVCPNGANWTGINVSGCADRVTATLNLGSSEVFTIGDTDYVLDVSGFFYNGELLEHFWTQEQKDNSAELIAHFTAITHQVPEVPLPSAALLLLGGLGGLSFLRRRAA